MSNNKWEFWIDRGGTFTDIVARKPNGELKTHKLLSENPAQYKDAAIEGIRNLLNVKTNEEIPADKIAAVKMGTTVATNALLERQGENTLLLITQGFADALRIGYQTRPDLFALDIKLPEMLYNKVIEVEERINANGEELLALNTNKATIELQQAFDDGYSSIAIVLMHGYRYSDNEKKLAQIAKEIGYTQISTSHEVSPLMKLVSRGDTTVVDAYLSPILRRYINQVADALSGMIKQGGQLKFMQSSGGLTDANLFQGKDAILSGPAGGIVGMVRTCELADYKELIGFDMGGTSTDVSHYNGTLNEGYERTFETEVAGVRMRAPMMLIHTVAAGGGSILQFDGARYRVGPESAGANPGPAAYRNGGPLTVTDCNVMLGKLQPDQFPAVFGPNADQELDNESVKQQFTQLSEKIKTHTSISSSPEDVATGFLHIAIESMANAVKKISVQRGYDVTHYALCCFGGAGGQHACLVADALGIKKVVLHPYAGVLSAYGMGLADTIATRQISIEKTFFDTLLAALKLSGTTLQGNCEEELSKQGISPSNCQSIWRLHCRYEGSDTSLSCIFNANNSQTKILKTIRSSFEEQHQQRFGFISPNKGLIVESLDVEVISLGESAENHKVTLPTTQGSSVGEHQVYMNHQWQNCPFYKRETLAANQTIDGPAVILESTGTNVIEPGWKATVTSRGNLILARYKTLDNTKAIGTDVDPVMLEIFNNLFMSIAEQMGFVLANTAASVNIKERLDFSCAIFSAEGDLVANAPHMPVHLGSMGESIKAVIANASDLSVGDAMILNAPYNGGTHLPDVTIIKPVFEGKDIVFYVASRGHHADIGGKTPGSAPADSTHINEEGIVIDNFILVDKGEFREKAIRDLLASGKYPARNPDMNIADFKAQLAACEKGAQELAKITNHYGLGVVQAYMSHVQDNAEESVRRVLETLQDGEFCYKMDDGNQVCVRIKVDKKNRKAIVDFTGTSPQHAGNYNAPIAITKAAVLYVFRCMVDDNIPLNEGCLKPLEIIVPKKSMISPEYPAAVIAGNVETSQVIVDTLFGALKVMAASQGSMNNFFWGNEEFQYYETLCGGAGATKNHDGTDAVHTHMTNSRLTDPEVLEYRFPVILDEFKIRKNSGGAGKHKGGEGIERKVRFLEPMTATLLTGHRKVPPYGMAGGGDGKIGVNLVERADGTQEDLGTTAEVALKAGDSIIIKSPGGGGYGNK